MEFFAILNQDYAERILRLNVNNEAQQRMFEIFEQSYQQFEQYNEYIAFNVDETPTKTECFFIEQFETDLDFSLAKNNPDQVSELHLGENAKLEHIVAIIALTEDDKILIQNFNRSNIVDLSKTLWVNLFSPSNQLVAATNDGIALDDRLIAILSPSQTIYFRSFNVLRHIFDMDHYFREATQEELTDFINNSSHFEVSNGFNLSQIDDTVVRTKIAIINKSEILNNYTVEQFIEAADSIGYQLPVNDTQDKIKMPNHKKPFKELLQFLSSNIYKDAITQKTRIAKSSRLYIHNSEV